MTDKAKQVVQRVRSRRRPKHSTATLLVIALIGAVIAITAGTANAGDGGPSALGVQPVEVALGGQPNDCSASISGRLPSAATYELRVENPQDDVTYPGPGGVSIRLDVSSDDKELGFTINGPAVMFDVIIKGGQKSTHFDYDTNGGPGGATTDQELHAPTKGNGSNLFSISHASFCYENVVPASGTVYVDANQNGTQDGGEGADSPRVITAYDSGSAVVASTTSGTNGDYTLLLPPGASVTVCEEAIADFVLTDPDNSTCASLGTSEAGGYSNVIAPATGLDFGNAPVICGQLLSDSFGVFDASFDLFIDGNSEAPCDNKIGQLTITSGQVNLPLTGPPGSSVAGIGVITKDFGSAPFVPLRYAQDSAGPYVVLPWCALRPKTGTDGNQFDPYLTDDAQYPSLAGVTDPGGAASVSCKVSVNENRNVSENGNTEGIQVTVVLIQDDPFWR